MAKLHRHVLVLLLAACSGESHYNPYVPDAAPSPDGCASQTYYADCDGDGLAPIDAQTIAACTAPAPSTCGGGWTTTNPAAGMADCNDSRADVKPGANEPCDGVDNNCNGAIDENGLTTFYRDGDGDGHGNPATSMTTCNAPSQYVSNNTDCNDLRADVNPDAMEVCDGVDNDCDTNVDDGVLKTFYRDADGDTFGDPTMTTAACTVPAGYSTNSSDCNDGNFAIKPTAIEQCDLVDNDCDMQTDEGVKSTFYRDADGDGFGDATQTTQACTAPAGYSASAADCNDGANTVHPNAVEVCWDNVDNNCTGIQDDAAECQIACNWSGARWLSHGHDTGNAIKVGVWASCAAGQLTYMDYVFVNPPGQGAVDPPPIALGTGDTKVGCDWGNSKRWASQGFDGNAAFDHGVDVTCSNARVTQLTWDKNALHPGQVPIFKQGQLGCNWSGAIHLSHGIDGNCAFDTGLHVTCHLGHITDMRATEAPGCARQRF